MEKQKFSKKAPKYSDVTLTKVFDKTDGKCHLCGKTLVFKNYGEKGARGEWQVEHSKPIAEGGTDHLNNLFPACPPCNQEKGSTKTAAEVRAKKNIERLPNSKATNVKIKEEKKSEGTKEGAILGSVIGSLAGGPVGALVGGVIGSEVGKFMTTDDKKTTKTKKKGKETDIFSSVFNLMKH
jgi:HNH endonuclease/Glycine zipper